MNKKINLISHYFGSPYFGSQYFCSVLTALSIAILLTLSQVGCGSSPSDNPINPISQPNGNNQNSNTRSGSGNNPTPASTAALTEKENLDNVLSQLVYFDSETTDLPSRIDVVGGYYDVDQAGTVYYVDNATSIRTDLEIRFDKAADRYVITNPGGVLPGHLPTHKGESNVLAWHQRSRGTYYLKKNNKNCYFQLAQQRLSGGDVFERLHAMERSVNARPLMFKDDAEWNEFKSDWVGVFKVFKDPKASLLIQGSSTVFISQNPMKGSNTSLFLADPACDTSSNMYTFDTPGSLSDLDINLFIPSLSELCFSSEHVRNSDHRIKGNNTDRVVYVENEIEKCIWQSSDLNVRALAKYPRQMINATLGFKRSAGTGAIQTLFRRVEDLTKVHQSKLDQNKLLYTMDGEFLRVLQKWSTRLGREINFSPRVLPEYIYGYNNRKYKPGVTDFDSDPAIQSRFHIEIK